MHLHSNTVPSRVIVMMRRAIPAFVALVALSQTAMAGVPLFGHVSCAVVHFYVARYSETAAETWARSHGASDAEIETARRCLHGGSVQTAARDRPDRASQVPAPVTEQQRAQHEPAERDPDQDAAHIASVQGQHTDPEQDSRDDRPGVHSLIRSKDIEDRFARHASYEIKDPAHSGAKTTTLRLRSAGAMHRAHKMRVVSPLAWLKRQLDHLVRRRQFSIAVLTFQGSRR
jgi:hypothetical protein